MSEVTSAIRAFTPIATRDRCDRQSGTEHGTWKTHLVARR